MLKVVTVLGTRPEIIRLSQVIQLLDQHVRHVLVHTGQNYDFELNEVFFEDLGLRKPDRFLNVDTTSVGTVYGNVLIGVEAVLREERPDAVLVLGDTNSSIGAIIAKRMRIPIYHMEAGNRAFDFNVPEEINRRIVDHVSDFNLVYTERSRQNLLMEGLPARRIYLTGSPLREVLEAHREAIERSSVIEELGLVEGRYFVASMHREENVDQPQRLEAILASLSAVAAEFDEPMVISTHPRTRKRLDSIGGASRDPRLRFVKPFGFFDFVRLQTGSRCVISDSGSISEEAAILGFRAVTLRDSMERPEALDAGSIMMAPLVPSHALLECVRFLVTTDRQRPHLGIPWEYEVPNTAERVLKLILGTARLSNAWHGIHGDHR
jgi:UDP-N-acetylglucosamine 2-epimerase (non-hydrolysing)